MQAVAITTARIMPAARTVLKETHDNSHEPPLTEQDGQFLVTFLLDNAKLLEKEARHRFGHNYDLEEIQSVAYLAAHKTMREMKLEYRNRTLKFTSLFEWYFRRELEKLKKIGCSTSKGVSAGDNNIYDDIEADCDDGYGDCVTAFDGADETDGVGTKRAAYYTTTKHNSGFIIDMHAINCARLPSAIAKPLKLALRVSRSNLKQVAGTTKVSLVSSKLWKNLREECTKRGLSAYIGTCLNGSLNRVLTLAPNDDQACLSLAKFGDVLDIARIGAETDQ